MESIKQSIHEKPLLRVKRLYKRHRHICRDLWNHVKIRTMFPTINWSDHEFEAEADDVAEEVILELYNKGF